MPVAPASHRVRGASPGVAGIPGQSQGGGAGTGCPPWLAGHPKPQCWPCSAFSPGHGGATLAAGWSCPSSARTADSPVPTCRALPPATLKSSLHHWRGPSRMRGWSRIPPSPSSCTGSSEVGRRGPSPCSGDASGMQPGVASCLTTPTHATLDFSRLGHNPDNCLPGPVLHRHQRGRDPACPVAPARGGRQPR